MTRNRSITLLRDYAGLLIFLASLFISIQLAWVIQHQRPDEVLVRSVVAALLALFVSIVCIWLVRRFTSEHGQSVARDLLNSLWPGFLLLFTPFHVLSLCRYRNQCDYWGDFFMVQFVVLAAAICFATVNKSPLTFFQTTKQKLANTSAMRFFASHQYLFAFILALTLLLFLGWGRFIHPEFFAEGGAIFLANALNDGWPSLFYSYDGFLHVFPRLIVLIGLSTVPIQHLAQFTVAVCFLVAASISALIVRSEYRWIIPSDVARWGICVLLCLTPGLFEMLGNLPTLHYMLFMLVGIILLKNPASTISPIEMIAVALTVLSTGLTVTLIPLALFRVIAKKLFSRQLSTVSQPTLSTIQPEWVLVLLLIIPSVWAAGHLLLNPASAAMKPGYVPLDLNDLFEGLVNMSTIYFLLFPLAGNYTVNEILLYVSPLPVFIPLALVIAKLINQRWEENQIFATFIVLWLMGMTAIPVMIFILRPDGFNFFLIDKFWLNMSWWMRYNYLVAVPGILLWFILLRPTNLSLVKKKASVFILIILSSGIFHAQYSFQIGRYTDRELWKEASVKLQKSFAAGCPRNFTINIYPNIDFQYKNRKSTRNCE